MPRDERSTRAPPIRRARRQRYLVAASGNLVTLTLVDLYWRLIEALYERGMPRVSAEDAPAVAEAHAQVVDALRRGDAAAARDTLRASHDESQRRFERWLAAAYRHATSEWRAWM